MAVQFKHIMLMVKDIPGTVKFYSEGLGLEVVKSSPGWAELNAGGTTIALHGASENGQSGSSPILSFHVDDIHATIDALTERGATLQGNIREPSFGKVAAMLTPDGSILSLLQPAAVGAKSH